MFLAILGIIMLLGAIFGIRPNTIAYAYRKLISWVGLLLIVVGVLVSFVRQIDAGFVGVQVLFGQVLGDVKSEGLSVVNPFVDMKSISTRTQNYTMSEVHNEGKQEGDDAIRALSKDGLEVVIDLTILYKIIPEKAPLIYREIGLDFEDRIIRPLTRTKIRDNAVYYDAVEFFSGKRDQFEGQIKQALEKELSTRGFVLENILVRNINLPKSVKESIERKITAEQESQRMKFVLDKERQEADRKRVEAQGIADAQQIISAKLSDKILQYESIKVQKELVGSPNSKVIILGNGKNVPFILGDGK
jgi:regulator of protease activity HflC (stomatin/prohibitin superfamily)